MPGGVAPSSVHAAGSNRSQSFYIAGSSSEAAALGAILIAVAAISVIAINRLAAGRMGGVFG